MNLYNILILATLSISIAKTNSQGQVSQVTFENRTGQPLQILWKTQSKNLVNKTVAYSPLKSDLKEQSMSIPKTISLISAFKITYDINTYFPGCSMYGNEQLSLISENLKQIKQGKKYIIEKGDCISTSPGRNTMSIKIAEKNI